MLVFTIIGCDSINNNSEPKDNDSNSNSNSNNNNVSSIGSVTSLSVKTKNVKSLYLGSVAVTESGNARAIVDGHGDISTLSYINENGKTAPVVFTSPSGKQYMLEIMGMDKLDDSRIITHYSGIYEVTVGEEGNIVGPKETKAGGALIDMNSGRVYELSTTWMEKRNGVNTFLHETFFIEDNICYFRADPPNYTVYKIDLTADSPKRVPITNGMFNPIHAVRPPFTIDGKMIGYFWDANISENKFYSVDSTGILPIKPLILASLPANAVSDTPGVNYVVTLHLYNEEEGIMVKDLSGKTWLYTTYFIANEGNSSENFIVKGLGRWSNLGTHYLIVQLNVDNNGNCKASNVTKGQLNFDGTHDQYVIDRYDAKIDFLTFYVNVAGIALPQHENAMGVGVRNLEAFQHNGVYLINTKGFVKITKKQNGIEQTSVALNIPGNLRKGVAVISKDEYLYWVEANVGIKRLKLASGATPEDVYINSGVVVSPVTNQRESIFVSGDDKLIFYQYSSGSLVKTYVLDLNNINAPIKILADNDIEIKAVAELNF